MANATATIVAQGVDSMGNSIAVGDYVLANVREYTQNPSSYKSGSARKMIRGHVDSFVGEGKVRIREDGVPANTIIKSWVSSHHVTLVAPAAMADWYKEALSFHKN